MKYFDKIIMIVVIISEEYFGRLTGDERVRHVIEQARYYGYSGDRVKGLIFCSRNRECEELSAKFNRLGYRTVALSGLQTDTAPDDNSGRRSWHHIHPRRL